MIGTRISHLGKERGYPRCALCDRPVEKLVSETNILKNVTTLVAHCHGATETAVLTDEQLAGAYFDGLAFKPPPQLPAPKKDPV